MRVALEPVTLPANAPLEIVQAWFTTSTKWTVRLTSPNLISPTAIRAFRPGAAERGVGRDVLADLETRVRVRTAELARRQGARRGSEPVEERVSGQHEP